MTPEDRTTAIRLLTDVGFVIVRMDSTTITVRPISARPMPSTTETWASLVRQGWTSLPRPES